MDIFCRKLKDIVVGTCLFLAICTSVQVSAGPAVYFAGFAYLGDYKDIDKNYPYTASLTKDDGKQFYLDKVLRDRIKNKVYPNFDLRIMEQVADINASAIVLAFALDRETTSVEQIGNVYKVITELSAQALFFDYKEKTLINSYPIVVQYIDVLDEYPTESYFRKTVDHLFTGGGAENVFNELISRIATVKLDHVNAARIQVSQVYLEDKAVTMLPDYFKKDPDNYRKYIASAFTAYLSKNQNVPMIPYSTGHAIGNKMALKVANGEVFNLKIPEPDYEVRLTVRGFKKALIEQTPVESAWAYGAYINIEVIEPMSGTNYINTQFMNAATKTVPASQNNIDDWAVYQETILGLFESLTKEVSSPSSKWISGHSPAKDAMKALERFNEVLKQCA